MNTGLVTAAPEMALLPEPGRRLAWLRPLCEADLERAHELEKSAYAHPWSRRQLADSLAEGHPAWALWSPAEAGEYVPPGGGDGLVLLGHLLCMRGHQELHLLNLTVAPSQQRQGWGRRLLQSWIGWARLQPVEQLLLEVRAANLAAQALYRACGFECVGQRRAYYPAAHGQREDAWVMCLRLQP